MSNITYTIQNGGLARVGLNEDVYSALLMYSDTMPSGWTSGDVVEFKSLAEAEINYNITSTNDSKYEWFQISQFFKANPSGVLWTCIADSGASYTFEEISTIQRASGGKVRRIGIQPFDAVLNTDDLDTIHTILTTLYNEEMPLTCVYAPNTYSTDFTTLPDLRAADNSDWITVNIGQDASGVGFELASGRTASISTLGQYIGLMSANEPNINLGWVGNFDWKQGNENDQVMIGTSDFNNIILSQIDTLTEKGYSFLRKRIGIAGTFLNDMPTASTLENNDFAYLTESNVMFKAVRDTRAVLNNFINQQILLDAEGKMAANEIKNIENSVGKPLLTMRDNGTISNYKVFVDPDQDVLSDSAIDVVIGIQPTATARYFYVTISFQASI